MSILYFFLILRIGFIEYNQIWQTFHDKTVILTLFLNVATIHLKMVDIRDFESCSEFCQYNLFKEYGCLAWLWSQWLKSISKGDYSVTRLDWHLGHWLRIRVSSLASNSVSTIYNGDIIVFFNSEHTTQILIGNKAFKSCQNSVKQSSICCLSCQILNILT